MPHAPCPMPNAQFKFKFCQPKRDRFKASSIIQLIEGDAIHRLYIAMIPGKINLEPK
jgi:hypothetical protein